MRNDGLFGRLSWKAPWFFRRVKRARPQVLSACHYAKVIMQSVTPPFHPLGFRRLESIVECRERCRDPPGPLIEPRLYNARTAPTRDAGALLRSVAPTTCTSSPMTRQRGIDPAACTITESRETEITASRCRSDDACSPPVHDGAGFLPFNAGTRTGRAFSCRAEPKTARPCTTSFSTMRAGRRFAKTSRRRYLWRSLRPPWPEGATGHPGHCTGDFLLIGHSISICRWLTRRCSRAHGRFRARKGTMNLSGARIARRLVDGRRVLRKKSRPFQTRRALDSSDDETSTSHFCI